jgi:DNA-directed RNA polymerase subunit RPC12/RpoP
VDRSETALSFVRTRKIHASSDRIDLPDRSFDMVFSSELLEHLESPVFEGTLTEMKRLSRKYLFITVPNDQSVEKDFIRCPSCGHVFNRAYHIRRFDAAGLAACFPEFHVKKSLTLGLGKRGYVPFLARIKHRITPASSWIAPFWADRGHRQSMCPSCSAEFEYPYRFHPVGFFLDIMNIPLSPKRPYWLMMLFEKE